MRSWRLKFYDHYGRKPIGYWSLRKSFYEFMMVMEYRIGLFMWDHFASKERKELVRKL